MTRPLLRLAALVLAMVLLGFTGPAGASEPLDPKRPDPVEKPLPKVPIPTIPVPQIPEIGVPGLDDCKQAPTPDMPGTGMGGFFAGTPEQLPAQADPFAAGSNTTIYEQYGYAGLRWNTYDLGCGPDMMRQPDAVIGTSMSNWLLQAPIALTALTGSLTKVAFNPAFLGVLDPSMTKVSQVLHDSLFASWAPGIIAVLGMIIIFASRRQALSTTAGAVGWAILIVLITTALFRWPVEAGQAADGTVTKTLGAVASKFTGHGDDVDPGIAVASNVEEAILYRGWLAGNFGSPDSQTAKTYGPALFKTQALTWREAELVHRDPEQGQKLIERKQEEYAAVAEAIKNDDPSAYEYLTGQRSETRVGYAALAVLGTFLALPFLLVSALLMLGCFLIVRLAVMMFPAFAVLGLLPATRGIVLGLGRTVGAAVVNAIIFGIGATVTIAVIGILFHPGGGTPAWLSLVLMPVFSFMMWVALKPFRRLTTVVNRGGDPFGDMTRSFGRATRTGGRLAKRAAVIGATAATSGAATGAAVSEALEDQKNDEPPQRAEARPGSTALPPPVLNTSVDDHPARQTRAPGPTPASPSAPPEPSTAVGRHRAITTTVAQPRALTGYAPVPTSTGVPPRPTEPEWMDGEDVYRIYRPDEDDGVEDPARDNAGDAA